MHIQKSFASDPGPAGSSPVGTLYIVGTPIGNLEDMTMRAIRTLREADWIAAEDTRQTRKLLTHFDIPAHGRLVSYHEHNKLSSGNELLDKLLAGQSVALVSDAGMPAISDPGEDLVRLAIGHNIPVVPVPGANAALSALVISGLSTERFRFIGFLPRERKRLAEALAELASAEETLIFYESPHRLAATLDAMLAAWGDRSAAVVRELTKRFEEALRGSLADIRQYVEEHPPKGEYCLIVEGRSASGAASSAGEEAAWWAPLTLEAHVAHYEQQLGLPRKEAMRRTASDRGLSRRDVYNELLKSGE